MEAIPSLMELLEAVPDPRGARGKRYPLPALLAWAVVALLAGMTSDEGRRRSRQAVGRGVPPTPGIHQAARPLQSHLLSGLSVPRRRGLRGACRSGDSRAAGCGGRPAPRPRWKSGQRQSENEPALQPCPDPRIALVSQVDID
ncbi:MAG: transposase family protein [Singulisphaera sp.]|nr:transposase family protein [Singulisphaera sp.]